MGWEQKWELFLAFLQEPRDSLLTWCRLTLMSLFGLLDIPIFFLCPLSANPNGICVRWNEQKIELMKHTVGETLVHTLLLGWIFGWGTTTRHHQRQLHNLWAADIFRQMFSLLAHMKNSDKRPWRRFMWGSEWEGVHERCFTVHHSIPIINIWIFSDSKISSSF